MLVFRLAVVFLLDEDVNILDFIPDEEVDDAEDDEDETDKDDDGHDADNEEEDCEDEGKYAAYVVEADNAVCLGWRRGGGRDVDRGCCRGYRWCYLGAAVFAVGCVFVYLFSALRAERVHRVKKSRLWLILIFVE